MDGDMTGGEVPLLCSEGNVADAWPWSARSEGGARPSWPSG